MIVIIKKSNIGIIALVFILLLAIYSLSLSMGHKDLVRESAGDVQIEAEEVSSSISTDDELVENTQKDGKNLIGTKDGGQRTVVVDAGHGGERVAGRGDPRRLAVREDGCGVEQRTGGDGVVGGRIAGHAERGDGRIQRVGVARPCCGGHAEAVDLVGQGGCAGADGFHMALDGYLAHVFLTGEGKRDIHGIGQTRSLCPHAKGDTRQRVVALPKRQLQMSPLRPACAAAFQHCAFRIKYRGEVAKPKGLQLLQRVQQRIGRVGKVQRHIVLLGGHKHILRRAQAYRTLQTSTKSYVIFGS